MGRSPLRPNLLSASACLGLARELLAETYCCGSIRWRDSLNTCLFFACSELASAYDCGKAERNAMLG